MAPTPLDGAPAIARRTLLRAAALTGLLASVGCSVSDPTIRGVSGASASGTAPVGEGSTAAATPTAPPTMPGSAAAAQAEDAVASIAAALVSSKAQLSAGQRRTAATVRDAHRLHATVLRTPDPTGRSTLGAAPGSTPAKPATVSLGALIAAEKSLAARQQKLVPSSRGFTALLFGSLSVAAATYAAALSVTGNVPVSKPVANPPEPEVLDDVAGVQAMVTQLYAMIYGYQLAAGKLPVSNPARRRALDGLIERRALRDRLISLLLARQASVPAAEPAYVPSVPVVDAGSAGQLLAKLETAFLPFTGQWLAAAARPADQGLAWATMQRAAALARSWGGPISAWPGWVQ